VAQTVTHPLRDPLGKLRCSFVQRFLAFCVFSDLLSCKPPAVPSSGAAHFDKKNPLCFL